MFKAVAAQDSGVVVENRYADPRMWGDRYNVFMMGASGTGVAIGDYDGDGRPDIFIVSKTDSCHLFRNLGNWKFEDVTEKARVGDQGEASLIWKQGAAFADVNNDGLLDIYVCRFAAPNLLYINQGDGTFREEAAKRGLAVNDSSVMGAFCDYDRDGWLDVFVQTNLLEPAQHPNGQRDHLFHNNRDGTFTEVTDRAGIAGEGQGHSATWWDYNNDGWPDLYVANDFDSPDRLYQNQRDGTFVDVIDQVVAHMPYSSMGSDLGDVNNDGLIDFLASDMATSNHIKDQRTVAVMRSIISEKTNDVPQPMRNSLYLNTGTGRCMEAAQLAGLAETDWTWAPRFEDFDNDGRLDLVVTNGMIRETHNSDINTRKLTAGSFAEKVQIERASPVLSEQHLAFRNLGDLRFEDVSAAWGFNLKGVSFGLATGDLDGDGDLDIVYTNYQGNVTLLRNDSETGHRAVIALRGKRSNRYGVGALVKLETAAGIQVRQLVLARGVLSTSEPVLHFGLGEQTRIAKLIIEWPSGQKQIFSDLPSDRKFFITEADDQDGPPQASAEIKPLFNEVGQSLHMALVARENPIDELIQQRLLPFRQNRRGPALAIGDLSGSGRDDIIFGGTSADGARIIMSGEVDSLLLGESALNDGPVLIFDADGDGANDVLITKSGSALPAGAPQYQPRLLLNQHNEGLRPAPADMLPVISMSVGAAAAVDFDRDGRLDLFLGGRVLPGMYPLAPRSALLANRGGRFEDITDSIAPALRQIGMVTGAIWSDLDQDGWPDLLLTLEWGQVRCFHNEQGKSFVDWTERARFAEAGTGWWNSIAAADFNEDGRMDYVVGNVGLNTPYHATNAQPAVLYPGDFNGDGAMQLVEAYFEGDKLYPWRARRDLGAAIPSVLKRFPRNDAYARATLQEILSAQRLKEADRLAATEFSSGVFLSQPDGGYRFTPLSRIAQIAPVEGIVAGDFDGDGHADICLAQNSYAPVPSVGRFDGGVGQFLRGDGHGGFVAVPAAESGLVIPGDGRALASLDVDYDGAPDLMVTRNQQPALVFRNTKSTVRHWLNVRLVGAKGNSNAIGARLSFEPADGSRQTTEIYAGSGYFSQSPARATFGWPENTQPARVHVRWPDGRETVRTVPPSAKLVVVRADGTAQ
ncbi:MAG TPA: FG-GAP-like repeat-containing protein [Opitutaceae bacterium]|nr:FG-GAP-like repeat-containing protein [Opitutaceae bacterium]